MIKAIILAIFIILIALTVLAIYACMVIASKCDDEKSINYEKYTLNSKNMNITNKEIKPVSYVQSKNKNKIQHNRNQNKWY